MLYKLKNKFFRGTSSRVQRGISDDLLTCWVVSKNLSNILCLASSLLCFHAASAATVLSTSNPTMEQFSALASQYETDLFAYSPEWGIFWGKQDVAQDRFMDRSIAATIKWQQKEDDYLAALNQLDENALKSSHLYNTYRLLKESLENNQAIRVCKENLWNINPTFNGWIAITAQVADAQPVGTPQNRALALKRWSTFSSLVDVEINNLKEGLNQGYTAPKAAVAIVLKQVNIILEGEPEDSPYFDFARRDGDETFKNQVKDLITTAINPALKRYADYLVTDYQPVARQEIGVSALPNGTTCYLAKVKHETTLNIPAKDIYDYGLQHMETLNKEVATIGLKQFGVADMTHVFHLVQTKPEYLFKSEQDILNYNLSALERAKAKVSAWFGIIPTQECIIKPYPVFRAKTGASGEYSPPSEDGTRPGIFYINTYQPNTRSRADQEATLFHELIPGHHFQISISFEKKLHHSLDKYFFNSGFGEGWALYAERLADEMALYSDDISRIGMLSNEALRTARLVVDPGIHVMHWTREQAIDYLMQHTTLSETIIKGEVDRYITNPGQATSYMLGKREIENLRQLAQARLKDKFDIRDFHDQVLKNGMVTLPVLKDNIQQWLGQSMKNSTGLRH